MKPGTTDDIRRAARNQRIAIELVDANLTNKCPDWAVVVAFYAAVRCINAYIWEAVEQTIENHYERRNFVDSAPELLPIASQYANLYNLSIRVRYRRLPPLNRQTIDDA